MSAYLNPADLPPVLEIEITAAHIAAGRKLNCRRCPAALALRSTYSGLHWRVGYQVEVNGCARIYQIPTDLKAFIGAFDWDNPVAPGKFTLTEAVA